MYLLGLALPLVSPSVNCFSFALGLSRAGIVVQERYVGLVRVHVHVAIIYSSWRHFRDIFASFGLF